MSLDGEGGREAVVEGGREGGREEGREGGRDGRGGREGGYTLLVRRFVSSKVHESEGSLVRRFVS